MDDLTFVTVCRGRLEQLRQTLPRLECFGVPIVVVDYDCPDMLASTEWLYRLRRCENSRFIQSGLRPYMNLNEARNIGVRATQTAVVCMIDCDVLVEDWASLVDHVEHLRHRQLLLRVRPPNGSLSGTAMFRLADYVAIGGYDEAINRFGPGYDEIDFYHRLSRLGVTEEFFATDIFRHIEHSEHAANYPINHRQLSDQLNQIYLLVKTELLNMFGPSTTELEYQYRVDLMDRICGAFLTSISNLAWKEDKAMESDKSMQLTIQVGESMAGAARVVRHLQYSIDTEQILKKCELTWSQIHAIVERVRSAHGVSVR